MPARPATNSVQGLTKPVKTATILARTPEKTEPQFVAPAQPWMAALDRTAKLLFGVWVEVADRPQDLLFYSWSGDGTVHSLETIFPRARYLPGQAVEHRLRLMVLAGLSDVHLLTPDYALYLAKRPPALEFNLGVVSPRDGSSLSFRVLVKGAQGQAASEAVRADGLSSSKPVFVSARVSPKNLPPGQYELWIAEDGGGAHALVGQPFELGGE